MITKKQIIKKHFDKENVDESIEICMDIYTNQFKYILTSCGKLVIFDDEDYDFLRKKTLFLSKHNSDILTTGKSSNGIKTALPVAKLLLKCKGTAIIHYADGNKLNIIKSNISLKNRQQAHGSQKKSKNNTSGYKGVSFNESSKKFSAQIKVKGKKIHLGYFVDVLDAASAYNVAAKKNFGKYAKLNEL